MVACANGTTASEFDSTDGQRYGQAGKQLRTHQQSVTRLTDATTDGTYTYAARYDDNGPSGIYRGDMLFGGLTEIATFEYGALGVSYGAGYLWASDLFGSLFKYTTDGELVSSRNFFYPNELGEHFNGLAYETSSNSLWAMGPNNLAL